MQKRQKMSKLTSRQNLLRASKMRHYNGNHPGAAVRNGSHRILLNAEDVAAAEKLVAGDPFTQLDVTRDRYLRAWKVTVGEV